ncbi:MAG: hypothetical protein Q8P18_12235 [Pseudomonadota bacterium]|nr:hypothetical protein [Pseudomonadota bacterium]
MRLDSLMARATSTGSEAARRTMASTASSNGPAGSWPIGQVEVASFEVETQR